MKTSNRLLYCGLIFIFILGFNAVPEENVQAAGTISLTTMGATYYQNFDTLATSGSSGIVPLGWGLIEAESNANTTYTAGTGSLSTGDTYSYGTSGSTERALGGLRSGTLVPTFGACFTNNSGSTITDLNIAYTGEEWRLGAPARTDRINFEFSTNATSLITGTWTGISSLDFVTPNIATTGAKDGNLGANRRALSSTIHSLSIPNGSTFWIRWTDVDAASSDDGLAIDDFSLMPLGIVPPSLSINDVALKEGHSGVTTFMFTVDLSSPALTGGVTFDVATADNSATTADGDYAVNQLPGQTIPAGSSTYNFNVFVNGDPRTESDETFFVNVNNVSGATIADGQGLGTINNDDTTTTVATSGSPSAVGSTVTFTATVNEPGAGTPIGTVEFFDGGVSLGPPVGFGLGAQAVFSTDSLAVGLHTVTATYSGDAIFSGSTSSDLIQIVEGLPSVLQITDTLGREILDNEHTNIAITQLLVEFSKAMNAAGAQTIANYSLTRDGLPVIAINSITYAAQTATLNVNSGAALPDGRYILTVRGALEDTLGAPIGTDLVRTFFVDTSAPHHTNVVTLPDSNPITNGVTVNVHFSSIQITFDEDVNDPAGNTDRDDVTNPSNYVLVTPGPDGVFNKASCAPGLAGGDIQIFTGPVIYNNHGGSGPFVATVQLNGGTALPNGTYRLFVCGTTSILDLAGNALNNGVDEQLTFNVLVIARHNPQTGFAPGVVTLLPEQPADKAYTDLGDLWIEIPRLNLRTSITGVPLKADGWDVTWLNRQVGWLEGTAYPTWEGNTVLTAHGYTADGEAGPFASIKDLSYGETIVIHLGGIKYTYAVRTNLLISPKDTRWLTRHEKLDWITLITCQQYDAKTQSYRYRRAVRAVLIKVEEE